MTRTDQMLRCTAVTLALHTTRHLDIIMKISSLTPIILFLSSITALPWDQKIFHRFGDKTKIIDCGNTDDILQIQEYNIEPNPPIPGKNLTITGKGTLSEDIIDGSFADVSVKIGFVKLLTKRFDTCEQAKEIDKECPIKQGIVTLEKTVELPSEIPPAKITADIRVAMPDNRQIACIKAIVDFT